LEEASETALAGDDGDGVEEAAHSRFGGLAVINTMGCKLGVRSDCVGLTVWS
jgi:hypothetical protein